jgi:hypothetical protein
MISNTREDSEPVSAVDPQDQRSFRHIVDYPSVSVGSACPQGEEGGAEPPRGGLRSLFFFSLGEFGWTGEKGHVALG